MPLPHCIEDFASFVFPIDSSSFLFSGDGLRRCRKTLCIDLISSDFPRVSFYRRVDPTALFESRCFLAVIIRIASEMASGLPSAPDIAAVALLSASLRLPASYFAIGRSSLGTRTPPLLESPPPDMIVSFLPNSTSVILDPSV